MLGMKPKVGPKKGMAKKMRSGGAVKKMRSGGAVKKSTSAVRSSSSKSL